MTDREMSSDGRRYFDDKRELDQSNTMDSRYSDSSIEGMYIHFRDELELYEGRGTLVKVYRIEWNSSPSSVTTERGDKAQGDEFTDRYIVTFRDDYSAGSFYYRILGTDKEEAYKIFYRYFTSEESWIESQK